MVKRAFASVVGAGLLISLVAAPAFGAAPSTPRHEEFVEIWCHTPEGPALWKRVDVHAIDPGNIAGSIANFNANNPYGESCQIGPFD